MAWDEMKFNAALANKLHNQDLHSQIEGFNATTNRMNAATQADLLPSQQATHLAAAQAGLMNAGTTRGQLAAANPQGFSQVQMGGFGLRGMPGPTGAGFSAAPPMGAIEQQWAARQAKDAANPGPGMPTATTYGDITGQKPPGLISDRPYPNGARGGPMGDVEHDTGQDTQHAMVRPGEYMVDPNAVGKAFGGGDYHEGVRNLNRIIHNATGYEPGATYGKKGKAGYALSGDVPAKKKKFSPLAVAPNAHFNAAMGAAPAMPVFGGAPEPIHPELAAAAARPQVTNPGAERLASIEGIGGLPNDPTAQTPAWMGSPLSALNNLVRPDSPSAQSWRAANEAAAAAAAGAAPAAPTGVRGKYDMSEDVGTSARTTPIPKWAPMPQHITESGGQFQIRDKIQSHGRPGETFSLDYGVGHGMGPNKAPIYATADQTGKFNMFSDRAPVPTAAGQAAIPAPVRPDIQSQIAWREGALAPRPPLPQIPAGMPRAPAAPAQGLAADTAWAEENKNKFPQLARGGVVLGRGLRMAKGGQVPGFDVSGVVKPGFFPVPVGAPVDVSDPVARAQALQDRWAQAQQGNARLASGGDDVQAPDAAARDAAARTAAEAEAKTKGTKWRDAYERLKTQPVDVKAGLRTAAEAVKPYVPSAKTIGGVTEFAGKKVLRPLAIANDVLGFTDVASDPRHHGWETAGKVAEDVAGKGLNWGGAGGGALAGGMLGAAVGGPLAPVTGAIGALAGGIGGYEGIDWLQGKAREALGASKNLPSDESQGWYSKLTGRNQTPDPNAVDPRVTDFQKRGAAWAANERAEAAQRAQAQAQGLRGGPGGGAQPSVRDMLMMRAMGGGGPGTGSMDEQRNILNYLGTTERDQTAGAAAMLKASTEHEKEIEASLGAQFETTTTDPKTGKTERVPHPEMLQLFAADEATRGNNVYQMSRGERDRALAEWKARHRADDRANKIIGGSGDPNQPISERIQPISLRSGSMGFGDWWGNPNVGIGDYAKSFIGKGLQNRVAVRDTIDPNTGRPLKQVFPAAKIFGDEQGQDIDSLRYARGQ